MQGWTIPASHGDSQYDQVRTNRRRYINCAFWEVSIGRLLSILLADGGPPRGSWRHCHSTTSVNYRCCSRIWNCRRGIWPAWLVKIINMSINRRFHDIWISDGRTNYFLSWNLKILLSRVASQCYFFQSAMQHDVVLILVSMAWYYLGMWPQYLAKPVQVTHLLCFRTPRLIQPSLNLFISHPESQMVSHFMHNRHSWPSNLDYRPPVNFPRRIFFRVVLLSLASP